jgi:hypothetical protein
MLVKRLEDEWDEGKKFYSDNPPIRRMQVLKCIVKGALVHAHFCLWTEKGNEEVFL